MDAKFYLPEISDNAKFYSPICLVYAGKTQIFKFCKDGFSFGDDKSIGLAYGDTEKLKSLANTLQDLTCPTGFRFRSCFHYNKELLLCILDAIYSSLDNTNEDVRNVDDMYWDKLNYIYYEVMKDVCTYLVAKWNFSVFECTSFQNNVNTIKNAELKCLGEGIMLPRGALTIGGEYQFQQEQQGIRFAHDSGANLKQSVGVFKQLTNNQLLVSFNGSSVFSNIISRIDTPEALIKALRKFYVDGVTEINTCLVNIQTFQDMFDSLPNSDDESLSWSSCVKCFLRWRNDKTSKSAKIALLPFLDVFEEKLKVFDGNHRLVSMDEINNLASNSLLRCTVYEDLDRREETALGDMMQKQGFFGPQAQDPYMLLVYASFIRIIPRFYGGLKGVPSMKSCPRRQGSFFSDKNVTFLPETESIRCDTVKPGDITGPDDDRVKLINADIDDLIQFNESYNSQLSSWCWLAYNEPYVTCCILQYAKACYMKKFKPLTFQSIFGTPKCLTSCAQTARTFYWMTKYIIDYKCTQGNQTVPLVSKDCKVILNKMKLSLQDALRVFLIKQCMNNEAEQFSQTILIYMWNSQVKSTHKNNAIFQNEEALKAFQKFRYLSLKAELMKVSIAFKFNSTLENFIDELKAAYMPPEDEDDEQAPLKVPDSLKTKAKNAKKRKRSSKTDFSPAVETKTAQHTIHQALERKERAEKRLKAKEEVEAKGGKAAKVNRDLKGYDGEGVTNVSCSTPDVYTLNLPQICSWVTANICLNDIFFLEPRGVNLDEDKFKLLIQTMCGQKGSDYMFEMFKPGQMWNDEIMISVSNLLQQFASGKYLMMYPHATTRKKCAKTFHAYIRNQIQEDGSDALVICPTHIEAKYMRPSQGPTISDKPEVDHWILVVVKGKKHINDGEISLKDAKLIVYDSLASLALKKNVHEIPVIQNLIEDLGLEQVEIEFKFSEKVQTKQNDCGPLVCMFAYLVVSMEDDDDDQEVSEHFKISRDFIKNGLLRYMLATLMVHRTNLNTEQVNALLGALGHLKGQDMNIGDKLAFYGAENVYSISQSQRLVGLWLSNAKTLLLQGDSFKLSYESNDEELNNLAYFFRVGDDEELYVTTETKEMLIDFHERQVAFSRGSFKTILRKMSEFGNEEEDEGDIDNVDKSRHLKFKCGDLRLFLERIGGYRSEEFIRLVLDCDDDLKKDIMPVKSTGV